MLFTIQFKDAYFTRYRDVQNLIRNLNEFARKTSIASGDGTYWSISHIQISDDTTWQIIVSGLHCDRKSAVVTWRDLLSCRVGFITHEELLSEDRTWLVARGKPLHQSIHFYAHARWRAVHDEVRDYAFALACVGFPAYVILELIDFAETVIAMQNEFKKVTLITSVISSMKRIVARRNIAL